MKNRFKVGDRVRFKSWEEMVEEFGLIDNFMIKTHIFFPIYMRHLCGTYATVKEIEGVAVKLKKFTGKKPRNWFYSVDMLKFAEVSDED